MDVRYRVILLATVGVVLGLVSAAGAKTLIVPPRPGQVGLSVQGQYGTLLSAGNLGESFTNGPGLAVRVRYRMRYERAIGLSFESQSFDTRAGASFRDFDGTPIAPGSGFEPTKVTLTLAGAEFYKLYGTRTGVTRMLSAGLGISQIHKTLVDGETQFESDGFFLSAGAGFEKFFWRSWAYDLSTRYFAMFEDGRTNHEFQASLGLVLYASY